MVSHEEARKLAGSFAHKAHSVKDQRRKYTGEPYAVHPLRVSYLVADVTDDPALLIAACLHDVLEDTDTTKQEIADKFGQRVADLVEELTDVSKPEDGNRQTRKALDRERISKVSADAKTIKLADLIDNTVDIVTHDPDFAKVYLEEKRLLLEVLKEGNPKLYAMATTIMEQGFNKIKELK